MTHQIPVDLDSELKKCRTMDDLTGKNGLLQRLLGPMIEKMLQCEMDEKLGYERHSRQEKDSKNRRNGTTKKTVQGSFGDVEIAIPRDREGEYEPKLIKKHQRTISSFDEKIISMYGKGMTTRDIQAHVYELYGADISPTTISNITEAVLEEAREWQLRPLQNVYAIVYLDAIHYKIREEGKVVSKASYTCFGIDLEGRKSVLGIWIGESEGAKFWLGVCSELKSRGVKDIFIACIDGLKGFPDAIKAVFPKTQIQLCVIHLIRSSLKYVSYKFTKTFLTDLKRVYQAPSESTAYTALEALQRRWGEKYPLAIKPWFSNWENVKTYFLFPEPLRRMIYTTNTVEALHRQFRKVTKNRAVFPNDEALTKLLYLAIRDISKKWTVPVRDWPAITTCLLLTYGDRLNADAETQHA